MKKIISFLLVLGILMSLNVTAYAADREITFIPASELYVDENTNGLWDVDSNGERYYWYAITDAINQEGNTIKVKWGTKVIEYTYRQYAYYDTETEQSYTSYDFVDSNDNSVLWQWDTDQYDNHWYPGNTYYFTLIVNELECQVPVTVRPSKVSSIELADGDYVTAPELKNGYVSFIYDFDKKVNIPYYHYFDSEVLGAAGLQLKINYTDGTTGSVTAQYHKDQYDDGCIEYYTFVDENGNDVELWAQSDQWSRPFYAGGENYIDITYLGREFSIPVQFTSDSSWLKYEGYWYYFKDGYAATGWKKISGKWYWFASLGEMKIGWLKLNNKWYYLSSSGAMVTGWNKIGGKWYYMNSSGVMKTGWLKQSGKWYYLDESGKMAVGWAQINNKWYYFNSNGSMRTGWLKLSGNWYYFLSSGEMAKGTQTINGKKYKFKPSGVCVNP